MISFVFFYTSTLWSVVNVATQVPSVGITDWNVTQPVKAEMLMLFVVPIGSPCFICAYFPTRELWSLLPWRTPRSVLLCLRKSLVLESWHRNTTAGRRRWWKQRRTHSSITIVRKILLQSVKKPSKRKRRYVQWTHSKYSISGLEIKCFHVTFAP